MKIISEAKYKVINNLFLLKKHLKWGERKFSNMFLNLMNKHILKLMIITDSKRCRYYRRL